MPKNKVETEKSDKKTKNKAVSGKRDNVNASEDVPYQYDAVIDDVIQDDPESPIFIREQEEVYNSIDTKIEAYMLQHNTNSIAGVMLNMMGVPESMTSGALTLYLGKYVLKRTNSFNYTWTVVTND